MPMTNAQFDRLKEIRKQKRIADNKKKNAPKLKKRKPYRKNYKKDYYKWQYKTQEWIELRDRIVTRDNNRCVGCGEKSKVLHVHHLLYEKGKKIWEVPDWYLVSLCPKCHVKEHSRLFAHPRKHF